MNIAIQMSKSSQDLIDEQNRIAVFWLAGNRSLMLAERFVAGIETLEARGLLDYGIQPEEAITEMLEFFYAHQD